LRIQVVRVEAHHLRARTALATLPRSDEKKSLLASVERDAKKIAGEKMVWATPLAQLLQAAIAVARSHPEAAIPLLRDAITGFESADMGLYAAVSRQRLAPIVGGDEGKVLQEKSDIWMRSEKVKNPPALVGALAPGF
jgi:hypothetical protein